MQGKLLITLAALTFAAGAQAAPDLKTQADDWLKNFKLADLDYSGGLSRAELDKPAGAQFKSIARQFNKLDSNRDGQVTPKEYTEHLQRVRDAWLAAFKAADLNGSGGLSRAELDKTKPNQFRALKKNFDAMDANKDGQVSVDERDNYTPASTGATTTATWLTDFRKLDLNDSGGLSQSELAKAPGNLFADLKQSFDKVDTDKDGQASAAEYTTFLEDDEEEETGILPFLRNLFK